MTRLDTTTRLRPHWVYRVYDDQGRALYVGCTSNPIGRMREQRWAHWWSDAANIEWDSYADYDAGTAAERDAIRILRPLWNKIRYGGRRPVGGAAPCIGASLLTEAAG